MSTGVSSAGNSGEIKIASGDAYREVSPRNPKKVSGSGGGITLSVGTGDWGNGGDVSISAGSTRSMDALRALKQPVNSTGGSVVIASGGSQESSSGDISILTADSGREGVSGYLKLKTGEASSGTAGYIGELSIHNTRMQRI